MTNHMMKVFGAIILSLVILPNVFADTTFTIARVFQDNMVLQQQTLVSVWGTGIPSAKVVVEGSWGKKAVTTVDANGRWKVKLQTPKAGGPYEVTLRSGTSSRTLRNVLIGEVWLCSGQSNMEMPLEGWPPSDTILNSAAEIEQATFPHIRLLHVQHNYAAEPTEELYGTWEECSPTTVRTFSAVAYFFGRELYQKLKVPIGLIEAAWGGTAVEPWMSKETLQQFPEYTSILDGIEQSKDSLKVLNTWLTQHPFLEIEQKPVTERYENLQFDDADCFKKEFNDSSWLPVDVPKLWEQSVIGDFDGVVWYRKTIEIPREWIGKSLTLFLGPIDDMDETYVNGVSVGKTLQSGYWKIDRTYTVPDTLVSDSLLTVAVRVIDTQGGGGIWGDGKKTFLRCDSLGTEISLDGTWRCMPVAEYRNGLFYILGIGPNGYLERPKLPVTISGYTPTTLFNGMIYPLVPFTIRGAIWYQGESNVYDAKMYERTFPAMIQNWRKVFAVGDFPFYYVQIAPYDYGTTSYSERLRDAQRLTLNRVKNTGMAVTLDIGDPKNIHPCNKQEVGRRLSLWALAKTYKKPVGICSGPLYKKMIRKNKKLLLTFDYAGKGLVITEKDGDHQFQIAGPDGVFRKAIVEVKGKTLLVSHPDIEKPVTVRYAWSNTASATFFNKEGLPASSFEAALP